jgi:hypothetical protein
VKDLESLAPIRCHLCSGPTEKKEFQTFSYQWCGACRVEAEEKAPAATSGTQFSLPEGVYVDWSKVRWKTYTPTVVLNSAPPSPTTTAPAASGPRFKPGDKVKYYMGRVLTVVAGDKDKKGYTRSEAYFPPEAILCDDGYFYTESGLSHA